jgi:hypothetical protein
MRRTPPREFGPWQWLPYSTQIEDPLKQALHAVPLRAI